MDINKKNTSLCFVTLPLSSLTSLEYEIKNRVKLTDTDSDYVYRDEDENDGTPSTTPQLKSMAMGILYLSSYIKKEFGSSVNQYMCDLLLEVERLDEYNSIDDFILETIKKNVPKSPDIIAISLMFMFNYKLFKKIVKIYKLLWPSTTIIVGGIHASNTSKLILQTTDTDYVFRGEGEIALAKFIKNHMNGENQNVPGIYNKKSLSSDCKSVCETPNDLDKLPYPNWDLVDLPAYVNQPAFLHGLGSKVLPLVGSRGCPYVCSFCSIRTVFPRNNIRYRSMDNIRGEINELYKRVGVTKFIFNDDLINIKESRFIELCDVFKNNKPEYEYPSNLKFNTQGLHCNLINKKTIDAYATIADTVYLPIEHGSQYAQNHIVNKKIKLERVKNEIVPYCHEKGLIVRANFLFGFPKETKEIMDESANYMRTLNVDWYNLCLANSLPGTDMSTQFEEMGGIKKDDEDHWEMSNTYAYLSKSALNNEALVLSPEEMKDFIYSLNLELNFVNNYNLREGLYKRAIHLFKEVVDVFPPHVFAWMSLYEAYKGLDDVDNCNFAFKKVLAIINDSEQSWKMFDRYRNLLKGKTFYNLSRNKNNLQDSLSL